MTDVMESKIEDAVNHKRKSELITTTKENGADGAKKVKKAKQSISIKSSAIEICEAFFKCMDFNGNGFIEEGESKILSVVAFDKDLESADAHWNAMVTAMDRDSDGKISKDEYVAWWTERHANKSVKEDGTFVEDYARYLLECLQRISSVKVAQRMCDTFFEAIDYDHNGYLEEEEVKNVSRWAFGKSAEEAEATWQDMLEKMDSNNDRRISQAEYRTYWLANAKTKIQPDGTFVEGYKRYLLKKLMKIKNGNARQEQIRKWEKENPKSATAVSPEKRSSVSFQEE
mmetsp:Transcript_44361/g.106879  ORF Transcript_44361/g.106879 Transcript_44361/m.106879 type:complete len:286 (-) Transcript_44361:2028-2885(-)